ncbi:hypothetical protein ACVWZ4_007413 [Bradyrhizobium sp. USDA 4472]
MAGKISMGARREVVSAVTERYRSAERAEKGRILDETCATTGWHRKHAVRALRRRETVRPGEVEATRKRRRRYGATIKDALTALWEASDRVCGKRLKVMIPTLLPALEQHGRLQLGQSDRDRVLAISAATIDRLLVDVKIAAMKVTGIAKGAFRGIATSRGAGIACRLPTLKNMGERRVSCRLFVV